MSPRPIVLSALLLAACPQSSNKCVAGKVESCPCALGTGTQQCQSDGTFGACQCLGGVGGGNGAGGGFGSGGGVAAGGGFSSSGGGSSAGGGIGVTQQEVVSGTRLKALHLTGDDGSDLSSVNYFYDSQLQLLCAPGYPVSYWYLTGIAPGNPRCLPLYLLQEQGPDLFCDSSCQTGCGYTASLGVYGSSSDPVAGAFVADDFATLLDGGYGALFKYARLNDGGYAQLSGVTTTTTNEYRLTDAGCVNVTSDATVLQAVSSTPLPPSTFVEFTKRHD